MSRGRNIKLLTKLLPFAEVNICTFPGWFCSGRTRKWRVGVGTPLAADSLAPRRARGQRRRRPRALAVAAAAATAAGAGGVCRALHGARRPSRVASREGESRDVLRGPTCLVQSFKKKPKEGELNRTNPRLPLKGKSEEGDLNESVVDICLSNGHGGAAGLRCLLARVSAPGCSFGLLSRKT